MKGLVVFDTSHGNTKAIGVAISEGLKESGIEADAVYVKDVKKLNGKELGFLVLGSPTKFGTMSFAVKGFFGKVKSDEWQNKPFAAFDTENQENIDQSKIQNKEWSAAEKIAIKLREKNMIQLLPVHKAIVFGQKGPLKDGEVERAKEYAKELAVALNKLAGS
jgi:flavodoxin